MPTHRISSDGQSTAAMSRPGGNDPLAAIVPGATIDEFDLLIPLGRGAFGRVFLAWQSSMQRYVAVKISHANSHESRTLAQLNHAHIVRVFDQRRVPDTELRLMYMEYAPGGTLLGVLGLLERVPIENRSGALLVRAVDTAAAAGGRLDKPDTATRAELVALSWPETVAWLGSRLARALDHADRAGVLHRDIKPANVLLTADGQPKLADFGISYSRDLAGDNPIENFGGSMRYMSPEQLEACHPDLATTPADLDTRSDLFALAVVLWELLTGRPPFEDAPAPGETHLTLEHMIGLRRRPIDKRRRADLPRDCPPALRDALLSCLRPDPQQRFASGAEFAQQLDLVLDRTARDLVVPPDRSIRARFRMKPMPVVTLSSVAGQLVAAYYLYSHNTDVLAAHLTPGQYRRLVDVAIGCAIVGYPVGIALLVYWCRRVILVPRGLRRGQHYDDATLARARADTLACGDRIATVGFVSWSVLAALELAMLLSVADVPTAVLANVIVSILVAGAVAVSYTYFPITFYVLRWYYPGLLIPHRTTDGDVARLEKLTRRNQYFLGSGTTVPLIGAAAGLAFLPPEEQQAAVDSVIALCVGGYFGVAVSLFLFHILTTDIAVFERMLRAKN
ncbi:serine/threonine protein kinase [Nocardia sp. 2]|uniref:Serine/threonine protein kinase n=1 Tax=Nocardia acididurans TaxID=2802282 RepID=A0ABS1LZ90_9NOCA|nr:serine/threonine-protein kinase [Nocardia acididurans]MBL1073737.1 serine/threonine protein kinase [Nocardia acididurans]